MKFSNRITEMLGVEYPIVQAPRQTRWRSSR
jgi:NAD(P)H-dependent flavin oxidoreductase YrpB (nitropropane dioxygenase family)